MFDDRTGFIVKGDTMELLRRIELEIIRLIALMHKRAAMFDKNKLQ